MASSFERSRTVGIATSIHLSNVLSRTSSMRVSNSIRMMISESSSQLLIKAKEGDAVVVECLLDHPPDGLVDINARGERQMTALHLAAEGNHQNVVVRLLKDNSIDLNAQDELGRTALVIAAQSGLTEVAHILQEAGANGLICAHGGYTALHVAAWYGQLEVVNLLLGVSGPAEFSHGDLAFPPELPKKKSSHCHSCKDLPSSKDSSKKLKFFKRSVDNDGSMVKQLAGKFPFKNISPANGDAGVFGSPEQVSLSQSSKITVLKMLEAKTSAELFTPLHLAAAYGHHQVVGSLIRAYGKAAGITEVLNSVQERGGKEALSMVRTSIMQILNAQEDNSTDDARSGVLDKALGKILFPGSDFSSISWSTVDSMASFLNEKDCIGRTPLHYATWEQHAEVTAQLLELFIVNVNATDMDGFTPLHLAAWKGCETVVALLIAHDSKLQMLNPNLRARQNKATWARILEVKRLQQKLGTSLIAKNLQDNFFTEDRDGMTALHYAVEGGHEAIVAALASHTEIDVFAMATSTTRPTIMEAIAAAEEGEKCPTPLTIAFSMENTNLLLKLLKSGKRNKIMQDLRALRGYLSKPSKFEGNRTNVKAYHRELSKTAVRLIRSDSKVIESDLFFNLERELGVALNTLLHKPSRNTYTLLHHAAFAGLSTELEILLSVPDVAKEINVGDIDSQTALHFATMEQEIGAVKVLINDKTLKPNEEDSYNRTSLHLASDKGSRDIISLLMECTDVKLAVEKLYTERAVNDNAANAILVVAALIASVTYGGWLQPPLGYVQYSELKNYPGLNPSIASLSYAAVEVSSLRLFWIFNSLSFYFAMATVISGAAEVLPMKDAFIGQEVRMVRGGLVRTSIMLVMSVVCVLIAFAFAGLACLPPIPKYQQMMFWTTMSGMPSCVAMLFIFWFRMGSMLVTSSGHPQLKWLRLGEATLVSLPAGRLLWRIFKFLNFIPENYTRFQSSRQEDQIQSSRQEDQNQTCKRRIFFWLVKVFRLDREEYWRYHGQ